MGKPFFHTQSNQVMDDLLANKVTVGEIKERYQQPTWCTYPEALDGMMGCWSLMDLKGLRNRISKPFCRGCDCFKTKKS